MRTSRVRTRVVFASLLLLTLGAAADASAADLYVSGDLGVSNDLGEAGGNNTLGGPNRGDGRDASPVFGGAFGLAMPVEEALPWQLDLPRFDVRLELEGRGGRDSELTTNGAVPQFPYHSEVSSWALMGNLWVDLPVHGALARFFGRLPLLEPMRISLGGGAGLGTARLETSDSNVFGSRRAWNFAYQAGAGFGYQLTPRIDFGIGYRYVDVGAVDVGLRDSAGTPRGGYSLDLAAHEVASSLRIRFYALPLRRSFR